MYLLPTLTSLKRIAALGLVCSALIGCGNNDTATTSTSTSGDATKSQPASKTVAITSIIEHPALDSVKAGMLQALAENGYTEGQNLTVNYQTAQGNTATAGQIAKQFVADGPDAIVAIGTPSAQAVAAVTTDIPIVFSAVTDPVEAKLVSTLDGSGTNVTGASDVLPLEPQIALMQELIPNLKNVGYVYSPGEVNSTIILKQLREKLTPLGITVIEAPAQRSSDIAPAAKSLAGRVDMIYTSTDNNVVAAYSALAQVAREAKIPLVASNTDSVDHGAVAALGVNYHDLGLATGKIVLDIFAGKKPGDIPIYRADALDLHISKANAEAQGLTLPQSVIDRAAKVLP